MALKDNPKKGIASLALLEVGLFELGFVVVIIAVILGVLNYFNVISLNQLYPNQLGWLPQQTSSQQVEITNQTEQIPEVPPLLCPIKDTSTCGEPIIQNGKYLGIGFQLAPESEFYAAIPGTAFFLSQNIEGTVNRVSINGSDSAQGYEAIYEYFGESMSTTSATVLQGDLLGSVGEGKFNQGENVNLIFKLTDPNRMDVELKQSDFQLN